MENKNEQVDEIEIPEDEGLEGLDETTDWKAKAQEIEKKHREAGIRNRERTKALKDKVSSLEKLSQNASEKKDIKTDEFGLLQKTYLRAAGITEEDEVELAKSIQKKTGLDWDALVEDDYFKTKLESLRTTKANTNATSGIRGGKGSSAAKNTPEYWSAKGTPPTADEVPDRTTRMKIIKGMTTGSQGKQFYND